MKIVTIVGARPQFIKASMVSKELVKYANISETIIHTGQHFDENMSKIFFDEMGIPKPDHNLEINSLSHGSMTGKMLEKIERIILSERPDWVLVYGDTNSTLAGTLAAVKLGVSVAHVEAGLRSFNMEMPEEINRILTDRVSNLLFCPTEVAVNNLQKEGIVSNGNKVVLSGDVMYDAHLHFMDNAKKMSSIMRDLGLENSPFLLCTVHRPNNTDDQIRLKNIIRALNSLSSSHRVIFPMHPRTKAAITKNELEVLCEIIPPVSYLDMIELVRNSSLVITDSGGLQKEAYFSGKYCVTLRDETEWVELVDKGVVFITGADTNSILTLVEKLISKEGDFKERFYGNGKASVAVVEEFARA